MAGRNLAKWSPYDFTPLPNPRRKRAKPGAPRSGQSSGAMSPDTESSQALSNDLPIAEEDEQAVQTTPGTQQSRENRQSQITDTTRAFSLALEHAQATSRVPGIGDILGSFRQPEARPAFKEEPVDEDIMRLPLRKPTSANKRRYEKIRSSTPTATRPRTASTRRQAQRKANRDRDQIGEEMERANYEQQNTIVDLTADDEEQSLAQAYDTPPAVQHQGEIRSYQTSASSQHGDYGEIPETALHQVRGQYRQENVILPTYVKTWHQLEEFASRNQNQSCITPAFLSQIRDFYANLGLTQHGKSPSYPQFLSLAQGLGSQGPFPYHDRNRSMLGIQRPLPGITDNPFPHLTTADEQEVKRETSTQPPSTAGTERSSWPWTIHHPIHESRPRTQEKDQRQVFVSPSYRQGSVQPKICATQSLSAEAVVVLTQPSDALPDLLPPTTPTGQPHLVSLWNNDLLKLPTDQHSHLNLIDTVTSVIAKYDMKDQSTVKAFLDINECPHFFFLFKSRTSTWHSWSIEREWDIVTIGLERNNRASNTAESTRPSSGQFDVTVIYKMDKSTPVNITPPAVAESGPDASSKTIAPALLPPLTAINILTTNETPPLLPNTENSKVTQPSIPGKWTLHGTTIFPAQPSLSTFLWSTPPNRGADDVSRYHHPTQTSLLPTTHLSMLARYLQHTAFTCTAMEAEFQVAWGRKVRYDAQLGRVRPTWDYALKGAKTQKEKRKRGDYNVVPAVEKKNENGAGASGSSSTTQTTKDDGDGRKGDMARKSGKEERPGAGDTLDWLAGRDGIEDVNTVAEQGRRKRPKREEGDGSGSEYMASSDED